MTGRYPKPVVTKGDLKEVSWSFICGGGLTIPVSPVFESDISNELKAIMKKEKSYHSAMVAAMIHIDLKTGEKNPAYDSLTRSLPAQFMYANSYLLMGAEDFSSVRVCWMCMTELPILDFSESSLAAYNAVCRTCEGRRICIGCGVVGRSAEKETSGAASPSKDGKMTGFIPCPGCPSHYCSAKCLERDANEHARVCSGKADKDNKAVTLKITTVMVETLGDECPCMVFLEPGKSLEIYDAGNDLFPCIGCLKCCVTRMNFLGMVPTSSPEDGDVPIFENSESRLYTKPFATTEAEKSAKEGK